MTLEEIEKRAKEYEKDHGQVAAQDFKEGAKWVFNKLKSQKK